MSVVVLMYHRTPPSEAGHVLDTPMPLFRAQIQNLREAGVSFIPFAQALDLHHYVGEPKVAVTFDDGHVSNLEAMAFLYEQGIPSTNFFVSDYVRHGVGAEGFMRVAGLRMAAGLGEVGAHGTTHSDLMSLDPSDLAEELSGSRAFLEDLIGRPVTTMSAPGGRVDDRVVRAAVAAGYNTIGDSVWLANLRPRLPLHRLTMFSYHTPRFIRGIVSASVAYWHFRRVRRVGGRLAANLLNRT